MTTDNNLDALIKEYTQSLMKTYDKRNKELEEEVKVAAKEAETEAEALSVSADEPHINVKETVFAPLTEEQQKSEDEPLTDTASFFATVRTGGGAYPVENAKIIIGREDTVVSFLVTDENGDTAKVTLPAYPKKDSLSYDTAKEVMYYADVYANGFQEKKNLPISAVGGAEIVLNIELIPSEERME